MISHFLRGRALRLALGLTGAIGIPMAILLVFQYRSLRDLEETSAIVLETLSSQTADTLVNTMQADLQGPRIELAQLDDLLVERFDLDALRPALAKAGRSSVHLEAIYLWSRHASGAGRGQVLEYSTTPPEREGDPLERFQPAGPESAELMGLAEAMVRRRVTIGIETLTIDGRRQVAVLRPLYDALNGGEMQAFAGFRIDLDRLEHEYLPRAVTAELQKANRLPGLAELQVTALADDGRVVYQSAPGGPDHYVDERTLDIVFFDIDALNWLRAKPWRDRGPSTWRIRTGYGDQSIASIAHSSTASHRAQLAALMIVAFGGIFFGARAAVQEVRLAELKSNFVASVSHELKTPLALIQLFAETLELGRVKTAERAREYYTIISTETRKLAGLIDNILDLSRLESGLRPYRLEPTDLGEIVRSTLDGFQRQFEHHHVDLHVDYAPGPLVVAADFEAVEIALRNLLSNAIKYSPDAHDITVEVARDRAHGTVSVVDRGLGIPWHQQGRIFQKFYRVEQQAPDRPRGTGLGLAIVDQVMRAHGGRVSVVSEPGRGSTFTLVFPLLKEQPLAHEADTRDRRRTPDAAGVA